MSTGDDDRSARQPDAEQTALDHLVERLVVQFPDVSAEEIVAVVREKYADFGESRAPSTLRGSQWALRACGSTRGLECC